MTHSNKRATYKRMEYLLRYALRDLSILAGDQIGPSNMTWQDIAGIAADNLEALVAQLRAAKGGNAEAFIAFPSPSELLEVEK
jgi:hypothetical protein